MARTHMRGLMIHKHRIDHGNTLLRLPADTQFLRANVQHGQFYVWVLLGEKPLKDFNIQIVPTGISVKGTYIDTIFTEAFVWHVFRN